MLSKFGPRLRRAKRNRLALYIFTLAGIIFRSEIAILLAVHVALLVFVRGTSIQSVVIPAGAVAVVIGLTVTVAIDSFFWQKFPLWPELVAFRFNTIEGKSSEWGESPWYFYFVNSIPRLLLNPASFLVCIPSAVYIKATRRVSIEILAPLVGFVAVYSILPHKEWRFIIYIIPGLTAVASAGASWIWTRRSKSFVYQILALLLLTSVIASFMASCGLLAISSLNYPGAEALHRVHQIAHGSKASVAIHLDNLSCQTGITRFLEKPTPSSLADLKSETLWTYDKTEKPSLLRNPSFWERFDYVLAEFPEQVLGSWDAVDVVTGYAGIGISTDLSKSWTFGGNSSVSNAANELSGRVIRLIRSRVTRGRWFVIKMEPKITILKKRGTS